MIKSSARALSSLRAMALMLILSGCSTPLNQPGAEAEGEAEVKTASPSDYLKSTPYTQLTFEVDYVERLAPSEALLNAVTTGLGALLDKPRGVSWVLDEVLPPSDDPDPTQRVWRLEELEQLAQTHFNYEVDDTTTKIHTLFVGGRYQDDEGDERILGISWGHRHIVIFIANIIDLCQADVGQLTPPQRRRLCDDVIAGIWTHEIGHLIGLVNSGVSMVSDHEDPEHSGHDANPECIMYWSHQRGDLVGFMRSRLLMSDDAPPLGFDQACLDDLSALP